MEIPGNQNLKNLVGVPDNGFAAEGRQVQLSNPTFRDIFRGTRHLPVLSGSSQYFISSVSGWGLGLFHRVSPGFARLLIKKKVLQKLKILLN